MTQRILPGTLLAIDDADGALIIKGPLSTLHSLNSAATVNANVLKASSGEFLTIMASNTGTACFLKLYNKGTLPVVGTDIPVAVIPLMAGGSVGSFFNQDFGINGPKFTVGLGYAITGLATDADTTAIAAAQVKLVMQWR